MRVAPVARAAEPRPPAARPGHAVVVGGGGGGFGAAWGLQAGGWGRVTVVDAAPRPGGVAGEAGGPGFELGVKGMWRHYRNIARLLDELELPVAECYGPFAETAFWSSRGLEVVSPVLGDLPRLPAPLGPLVHTADRFTDLPLLDRFSAFPLVSRGGGRLSTCGCAQRGGGLTGYETDSGAPGVRRR